ncbi:MAG: hypothetical protein IID45_13875 [Planctomycetes bacterium]|nr:hypothetical protein [Planctomycetota bacterium]
MAAFLSGQTKRAAVVVVLFLVVLTESAVVAEIIPTTGTFDGVYHRDRWGVGHFSFFLVHPDLHAKLNKYRGKRIRLRVTKGDQPVNPGPAIILAVSKISRLADSSVRIHVDIIPPNPAPSTPFQMVFRLENTSDRSIHVRNSDVMIHIRHLRKTDQPNKPSFLIKAYTRGQLSVVETSEQMSQSLVRALGDSHTNLSSAHYLTIEPGEAFPLAIISDKGFLSGGYEIQASVTAMTHDRRKQVPRCVVWKRFDVARKNRGATEKRNADKDNLPLVVLKKSVSTLLDGYRATMMLKPRSAKHRRIVRCKTECSGRLRAFDAKGKEISLEVHQPFYRTGQPGPWRLRSVPPGGIPVRISFRKKSRFETAKIVKLSLDLLTDRGLESFVLSEKFKDTHVLPAVPFGTPTDGVKLRIRPARQSFKAGEPLRFHMQAVNVSRKNVVWWMPSNRLGKHILIEIDGKPIRQPQRKADGVSGWAADWTCKIPKESSVTLPPTTKIAKGKHTIRYTIISDGGNYKNANDVLVPLLRGRLASNLATFELK